MFETLSSKERARRDVAGALRDSQGDAPASRAPAIPRSNSARLGYLDWSRGLAVLVMLQGHVFHAFSRDPLRVQGPYVLSQLFGGEGPAIFLFVTGITLAFLLDGRERKGLGPWGRWKAAILRSLYLWTLAFLFRAQLWLFAFPGSSWTDLFKVDILNCMGFAIALLSFTALLTTPTRVRVCAILGVAIAGASPFVSSANWNWLPSGLSAYFVPNYAAFAFFPWAAFIAFGLSAGSVLRLVNSSDMGKVMLWSALGGTMLVVGGEFFSNLPYDVYPHAEYWLNSPGLVAVKLGVILLVVAFAWLWCEHAGMGTGRRNGSFVRQLGTTSLVVYWVHIEMVYGRWLGIWHRTFSAGECILATAVLILLMTGLSVLRSDWKTIAGRLRPRKSLPIAEPVLSEPELVESGRAAG